MLVKQRRYNEITQLIAKWKSDNTSLRFNVMMLETIFYFEKSRGIKNHDGYLLFRVLWLGL